MILGIFSQEEFLFEMCNARLGELFSRFLKEKLLHDIIIQQVHYL